jgi:hypothetical protein
MPIYTFKLYDGCGALEDRTGVALTDDQSAIRYARDVVHELMKHREVETRCWQLDVYEEGGKHVCEISFASVDPTLNHLSPELRAKVESLSEQKRFLSDARHALRVTLAESRALIARARGKPYLASRFGKPTIRDL